MSPEILTSKLSNSSKQMDFSRKLQYFLNTLIPDIFENEDCGDCKGLTWYSQSLALPSFSKNQKEAYRVRLSQPSFDCRSFTGYMKIKLSLLRSIQEFFFLHHVPLFPEGGTPLHGLYGDVPLDRVWFFDLSILNRVYNFTAVCPKQGI